MNDIVKEVKNHSTRTLAQKAGVDAGVIRRINMNDRVMLGDFVKVGVATGFTEDQTKKIWLSNLQETRTSIVRNMRLSRGFSENDMQKYTRHNIYLLDDVSTKTFLEVIEFLEKYPPIRELLQKSQRDNNFTLQDVADLMDINVTHLESWYAGKRVSPSLRTKCYAILNLNVYEPVVLPLKRTIKAEKDRSSNLSSVPTEPNIQKPNPFISPLVDKRMRLERHVDVALLVGENAAVMDVLNQINNQDLDLGLILKLVQEFKSYI